MRIEERLAAGAARPNSETADTQRARGASTNQPSAGGSGPDSLQLSSLAGRIRGVFDGMSAAHRARFEQVSEEVRGGRYRVDVERLSRALASEALG